MAVPEGVAFSWYHGESTPVGIAKSILLSDQCQFDV